MRVSFSFFEKVSVQDYLGNDDYEECSIIILLDYFINSFFQYWFVVDVGKAPNTCLSHRTHTLGLSISISYTVDTHSFYVEFRGF